MVEAIRFDVLVIQVYCLCLEPTVGTTGPRPWPNIAAAGRGTRSSAAVAEGVTEHAGQHQRLI